MTQKQIPTAIDDPAILLFWSQDEFIPVVTVVAMGFWSGWVGVSLLISLGVLKYYRRLRDGNPRGYFFHWAWWIGVGGTKDSFSIHNPYIREFRP